MLIETWQSDKGKEEIHHFDKEDPNIYLFGFNRQLLGEYLYQHFVKMVELKLQEIRFLK